MIDYSYSSFSTRLTFYLSGAILSKRTSSRVQYKRPLECQKYWLTLIRFQLPCCIFTQSSSIPVPYAMSRKRNEGTVVYSIKGLFQVHILVLLLVLPLSNSIDKKAQTSMFESLSDFIVDYNDVAFKSGKPFFLFAVHTLWCPRTVRDQTILVTITSQVESPKRDHGFPPDL